ncbi:MAG: ATP synthase F1 subunit delta [bacterium]|nr:ATP synthase F1 subunit delta [bacterium]
MAKLAAKVYGNALFEEALQSGKLDVLFDDVQQLKKVLIENAELLQLLAHPNIVKEEKIAVIERVFSGQICEELTGLLTIVVDKGRQKELLSILDYFIGQVKAYKKIGVVYVSSAVSLTEEQKEAICKKLLETTEFRELESHWLVDETLIGGLVIRIGDRVVDSSVKNKLEEMKRNLMKLQLA